MISSVELLHEVKGVRWWWGGGSKQDKNIGSRQQDAHGTQKDEWRDRGNGEEKRGRGYSGSQLCANWKKKKSCFEARRDILLFFPLPVKGRKGSVLQRGLRGPVSVTAAVSHAATCSPRCVLEKMQ